MNIHWSIFGCMFLGLLRQSRVCKGLRKDVSCDSGVRSNFRQFLAGLQCMADMEDGRAGYFRSWEDLPRDCFRERFGLDGSFQRRLFGYQWSASDSRTELAAGWVGAFWPILDEEPYQFPNKLTQKSQKSDKSHNTNHMHPTHPAIAIDCWIPSIPSMTSNPSCIDWDDTAYHCCSVNLLGMKHIACLPTRPFGSTCSHDCKNMAEGAYLR